MSHIYEIKNMKILAHIWEEARVKRWYQFASGGQKNLE